MPRGISLWSLRWRRGDRLPALAQDVDVGGEDEVVVEVAAEVGIAAGGVDLEGTSGRDVASMVR